MFFLFCVQIKISRIATNKQLLRLDLRYKSFLSNINKRIR